MVNELKEMMEKKRKIAEIVCLFGLYAVIIGVGLILIGLFQADAITKFLDDDHMVNPNMPHSELENATYQITPDDLKMIVDETYGFVTAGLVIFVIGAIIFIVLLSVFPSKKERHKLICTTNNLTSDHFEVMYCPICGLKLSTLDKK